MAEKSSNKKTVQRKKARPAEKRGKGSGFWIGMICFSSIWMFGLGIFVGRGTVHLQVDIEKIQDKLAALEKTLAKKEQEQFEDLSSKVNKKEHLEFYDDLKKPDPAPVPAAEKVKKAPDVKAVRPEPKKAAVPEKPAVQPLKEEPLAAEKKSDDTDARGNITEQPDTGDYRYTIQVASLKDPAAAEKMVQQLKRKGYSAYSMKSTVSGKGIWYRVRVGPFKRKDAAEKNLSRLQDDKYDALLITL